VLDPLLDATPSSWSSAAMPLDMVVRSTVLRNSEATSRGKTFIPPVVMVAS
jgi:hypothetical protein